MASAPFPLGFGPSEGTLRRSVLDPMTGEAVVARPAAPQWPDSIAERSWLLPGGISTSGELVPAAPKPVKFVGEMIRALPDIVPATIKGVDWFGRVARGEESIDDPETGHVKEDAVAKSFDLAGLAMTGSMPFSVPAGAMRSFGGRAAKTANLDALARAETLSGQGADRRAIWDQTGWFQGADKHWRFEIPDDFTLMKGTGTASELVDKRAKALGKLPSDVSVSDVMRHPALFEAYPDVAELGFSGSNQLRARGEFIGRDLVDYDGRDRIVLNNRLSDKDLHGTSLHEMAHKVQLTEGFATGARFDPDVVASGGLSPMDAYRRTAGEVEARNVQTRFAMSPQQRREIPPWLTQDVPDELQIVRGARGLDGASAESRGLQFNSGGAPIPFGFASPSEPMPEPERRPSPIPFGFPLAQGFR